MSTEIKVDEVLRRVISAQGHEVRLHNVKSVDNSGSWLRLQSDEGYVLVNPSNTLAMIVKGPKVI